MNGRSLAGVIWAQHCEKQRLVSALSAALRGDLNDIDIAPSELDLTPFWCIWVSVLPMVESDGVQLPRADVVHSHRSLGLGARSGQWITQAPSPYQTLALRPQRSALSIWGRETY
jgi:hypothetical protein